MKAVVYTKYGSVKELQLQEIAKPIPKENEVLIKIHAAFSKHNFKSKMLLQVHDELVFDAHKDEIEKIKPIILDCMQTALALPNDVPTDAEVGVGENWLEAH